MELSKISNVERQDWVFPSREAADWHELRYFQIEHWTRGSALDIVHRNKAGGVLDIRFVGHIRRSLMSALTNGVLSKPWLVLRNRGVLCRNRS